MRFSYVNVTTYQMWALLVYRTSRTMQVPLPVTRRVLITLPRSFLIEKGITRKFTTTWLGNQDFFFYISLNVTDISFILLFNQFSATDTNSVRVVFTACKEIIITNALKDQGSYISNRFPHNSTTLLDKTFSYGLTIITLLSLEPKQVSCLNFRVLRYGWKVFFLNWVRVLVEPISFSGIDW